MKKQITPEILQRAIEKLQKDIAAGKDFLCEKRELLDVVFFLREYGEVDTNELSEKQKKTVVKYARQNFGVQQKLDI